MRGELNFLGEYFNRFEYCTSNVDSDNNVLETRGTTQEPQQWHIRQHNIQTLKERENYSTNPCNGHRELSSPREIRWIWKDIDGKWIGKSICVWYCLSECEFEWNTIWCLRGGGRIWGHISLNIYATGYRGNVVDQWSILSSKHRVENVLLNCRWMKSDLKKLINNFNQSNSNILTKTG